MVWSQSKPLLNNPVYTSHLLLFHAILPIFPSLPTLINLLLTILSLVYLLTSEALGISL